MTGETRRVDRRSVLKAAGTAGAVAAGSGLAGCLGRGQTGPNTVQIAANTDIKSNIGKIESKLHEVGLPKEIELKAIAGAASTGARKQQYSRWLSANLEEPALFMMDSGWTIPFIIRDQLANITGRRPELAKTVEQEYFETFVRSATGPNGDLYGVPLFPTTGSMLYRKDLVKQAGYAPERNNWATSPPTWKRFAEITKQTREQSDTRYGFTFQAKSYEGLACCDFKEFTGTWGGSYFGPRKNLFGPVGRRPVTVDSDPVVKATRMVRTFVHGDGPGTLDAMTGNISPRAVLQWTEEPSRKPFTDGNAVMHRNWPYAILQSGAEDALGKKLGVMPIPSGVTEKNAMFDGYGGTMSSLGGWHLSLNPNSPKKEMALAVLRAVTSPEFQLFLFELLGFLPPRRSLFRSRRAKQVPVMGRYLDTLRVTLENSVQRPVTVAWPQEATKIAQKTNAALSGEVTPQTAMQTLERQLKHIEEASMRKDEQQGFGAPQPGLGTPQKGLDAPHGGR